MGNKSNVKRPVISTTLVTYNRLEYTKQTIETYLDTITVPYELFVVDNGSSDGTVEYLRKLGEEKKIKLLIENSINKFPGFAMNQGWGHAHPKAKFLHRSDNDLVYKKGWVELALQAFEDFPKMGQLGLINELIQLPPKDWEKYKKNHVKKGKSLVMTSPAGYGNVGGPSLIRADIFRKGVRWSEDRWDVQGNLNEDYLFSKAVIKAGWKVYELVDEKVIHIGWGDTKKYFEYYHETYSKRKMLSWFIYRVRLELEGKIKNARMID
jgi:glycosyltransferase involved in cell wall biosynthesis